MFGALKLSSGRFSEQEVTGANTLSWLREIAFADSLANVRELFCPYPFCEEGVNRLFIAESLLVLLALLLLSVVFVKETSSGDMVATIAKLDAQIKKEIPFAKRVFVEAEASPVGNT